MEIFKKTFPFYSILSTLMILAFMPLHAGDGKDEAYINSTKRHETTIPAKTKESAKKEPTQVKEEKTLDFSRHRLTRKEWDSLREPVDHLILENCGLTRKEVKVLSKKGGGFGASIYNTILI